MPTYMSAVPRSTDPPCSPASCNPCSKVRSGSPRRPCVLRMSASAIEQPRMSATNPARRRPSTQAEYPRCPASKSPLPQYTSPSNAAAEARQRWSSSSARSIARWACLMVPGASPRARACPARYSSIVAGRRRYSSSSATTISAEVSWGPSRWPVAGSSHRSASRRRSLRCPAAYQQDPGKLSTEHRPGLDHVVGEHLEPATQPGLLPGPAHCRDRELDQVRRSLEIPGSQRVADGHGLLAVLLVPRARPPVQVRHLARLLVEQARLQHVSEQMVVSIPPAAVIE